MTTPEDPSTQDHSTQDDSTQDASTSTRRDAGHVPVPAGGVRGVDQVDDMDPEPGHGTTTGADGETAAREQLRTSLGERSPDTGGEAGGDLEQAAALGPTDDPEGGSLQPHGSSGA